MLKNARYTYLVLIISILCTFHITGLQAQISSGLFAISQNTSQLHCAGCVIENPHLVLGKQFYKRSEFQIPTQALPFEIFQDLEFNSVLPSYSLVEVALSSLSTDPDALELTELPITLLPTLDGVGVLAEPIPISEIYYTVNTEYLSFFILVEEEFNGVQVGTSSTALMTSAFSFGVNYAKADPTFNQDVRTRTNICKELGSRRIGCSLMCELWASAVPPQYANCPQIIDDCPNTTVEVSNANTNSCDGTAEIRVSGGANNYFFKYSDGTSGVGLNERTGLCPGSYGVEIYSLKWIEDVENGLIDPNKLSTCDITTTVIDIKPGKPNPGVPNEPPVNPSECIGFEANIIIGREATTPFSCDGELKVNVTGGSNDYSIYWSNGVEGEFNGEICSSVPYTVLVFDNKTNCLASDQVIVGSKDANCVYNLDVSVLQRPTTLSSSDGRAYVTVTDASASGNYDINWLHGHKGASTQQLRAIDGVWVYDRITGCTGYKEVITRPMNALGCSLDLRIDLQNTSDISTCDGKAKVTANTGSGNYSYYWSNGTMASLADNLCPFVPYTVVVLDNETMCFGTATVSIEPNETPCLLEVEIFRIKYLQILFRAMGF